MVLTEHLKTNTNGGMLQLNEYMKWPDNRQSSPMGRANSNGTRLYTQNEPISFSSADGYRLLHVPVNMTKKSLQITTNYVSPTAAARKYRGCQNNRGHRAAAPCTHLEHMAHNIYHGVVVPRTRLSGAGAISSSHDSILDEFVDAVLECSATESNELPYVVRSWESAMFLSL